ncbi:MAG: PAS domain S-box protein [Anaerolineaceae bacterium]|nr:PAS domain S-box protein [Anaerolineaceae bacterium]
MENINRKSSAYDRVWRLLSPPVFPNDDEKTRTARTLYYIHILSFMVLVGTISYSLLAAEFKIGAVIFELVGISLLWGVFWVLRTGKVRLAALLTVMGLFTFATTYFILAGSSIALAGSLFIPVFALTALLVGWRTSIMTIGLIQVLILGIMTISGLGYPLPQLFPQPERADWAVFLFGSLATMFPVVFLYEETKKALRVLQENEERFRLVSSVTSDYLFSAYVNENAELEQDLPIGAFESITGYTPEAYLGIGGWRAILHPGDIAQDEHARAGLYENQRMASELRIVTKSGEIRWLRIYAHPVWDTERNQLLRIYGAAQDITERKQAEEREHEQRVLAEALRDTIVALANTLDLDQVMTLILSNVGQVVPHDAANIVLIEAGGTCRFAYTQGYSESVTEFMKSYHSRFDVFENFKTMMTTGEPVLVSNVSADSSWKPVAGFGPLHSYLGVPIKVKNDIIGFLNLDSHTPNFFTPVHTRHLQVFADQAMIAIKNAQLLEAERKQRVLAEALRDAAAAVSSTLDLDEVLNRIISNLDRVIPHSGANIMVVDNEEDVACVVRHCECYTHSGHKPPKLGRCISISERPHLQQMIIDPRPLAFPSVRGSLGWKPDSTTEWIQSYACAPICVEGEVVGFLSVDSDMPGTFTQDHANQLEVFANQAAVAIHNAKLYEEIQKYAAGLEQRVVERTEELQHTKERVEAILNSSSDAIILTSLNGNIGQTNPAFHKVFQFGVNEEIGQPLEMLVMPDFAEQLGRTVHEAITQNQPRRLEVAARRKNGTSFYADLVISPFTEDNQQVNGTICTLRDITERKQAEQALRESEARYRMLAENVKDVILKMDTQAHVTFATPSLVELLGYTPEEAITKDGFDIVHPDDADRVRQIMLDALQSGATSYNLEERLRHKDGHYVWVEAASNIIFDPMTHAPIEMIGVLRDVTERKQAEQALQESEARYIDLYENAPDMHVAVNMSTELIEQCNQTLVETLGYAKDEIIGRSILDMYYPDCWKEVEMIFQQFAETGSVYDQELQLRKKDGSKLDVSLSSTAIRDEDGNILRCRSTWRDISEHKKAAEALRESEQRLGLAVRAAKLGIWDWNPQTDVMVRDDMTRELYNIDTKRPSNYEEWLQCLHPEDRDRIDGENQAALRGESEYNVEFRIVHSNGSIRHIQSMAHVHRDENGTPTRMIGLNLDITERKQVEKELAQAKEAAEASNRAKSTFLANMSHEIRTPLNAILGFTQLMQRDSALPPKQHENLGTIYRSSQHLLALINDVLEFSKIEAGRASLIESVFDLHATLDSLQGMFALRTIQKGLQFTCNRTPDVPRFVVADEGKLRQILINLLSNAIKFTEVGNVALWVGYHSGKNSHTLRFAVEDTGVGIAPNEIDKIFDAFTQTASGERAQEGTGLGLAISQRFAHLLGGELQVSSQVGQGSTFSLTIPIRLTDTTHIEAKPTYPEQKVVGLAPNQPCYRVLVVEDHPESRILLSTLLEQVGFEVRTATNGREAVEMHATWQPHLIWLDIRLPVMNGIEAVRQIRASLNGQATVIIALTASAFEEERATILNAGCDDYLRKPFEEREIFDQMAQHLGVQFIYDKNESSRVKVFEDTQMPVDLTSADLAHLPAGWVVEVHNAAIRAKGKLVLDLIDHIRLDHEALAEKLTGLVHSFRFDKLVSLTAHGEPHE